MEQKIQALPGFQDVTSDMQITNPKVSIEIQRDKAATLGVTAEQIETALSYAYSSGEVSTILAPDNQYLVITELLPEYQLDPSVLSMLYVRSDTTGKLIPLNAVANFTTGVGPLTINHQGQLPAVTISFNLKPSVSLGDAANAIDRLAKNILPATINTSFQGTAAAFRSSLKGLGLLLALAILVYFHRL